MPGQQLPRTLQPPPELPDLGKDQNTLAQYLRTFALWCRHGFANKLDITTAAIGIPFQGFDAPFNTTPNAYQFEVNNAGVAGLAPIPPAGRPGTFVPIGSVGVKDGSSAPTGSIGEFVGSAWGDVALSNNVWTNVISMVLQSGDWDVWGQLNMYATAGSGNYQGGIGLTSATVAQDIALLGTTATYWYSGTTPKRITTSVPTTLYLIALVQFASGTSRASGNIQARRVR